MVVLDRPQWETSITDKLGETLKAVRLARGYTREQLSERTGVTERYIAAIENEGQIPRVTVLSALLHGLGLCHIAKSAVSGTLNISHPSAGMGIPA